MTPRARLRRGAEYVLGVFWMLFLIVLAWLGLAALVSVPVALVVGFWVVGNAALTWLGVI